MGAIPQGFFITLEGGEGAGKSTLQSQLADYLIANGYEVVKTREPGGSQLGEAIRTWLLDSNNSFKIAPRAELLLFLAARAQHIKELIEPALKAGKIVLCDRFNDSTIAYQGAARGLDIKSAQKLCQFVCEKIQPQLTLFLDVDPKQGLLRSQKLSKEHAESGKLDRIESEEIKFHEEVRKAFLALAKREPFRIYRIDANKSQSAVLEEAIRALDKLLLLPAKQNMRK